MVKCEEMFYLRITVVTREQTLFQLLDLNATFQLFGKIGLNCEWEIRLGILCRGCYAYPKLKTLVIGKGLSYSS